MRLQVLAVAVGAAVSLCLVLAWPTQQTIVYGLVVAADAGYSGDELGAYTTWFVFPVVLALGSWRIYRYIDRRLAQTATVE